MGEILDDGGVSIFRFKEFAINQQVPCLARPLMKGLHDSKTWAARPQSQLHVHLLADGAILRVTGRPGYVLNFSTCSDSDRKEKDVNCDVAASI